MNSERILLAVAAIICVVMVYGLFRPQSASDEPQPSMPTTLDRGPSGLHGLYTWLERSGIAVHSLRRRYDTLNKLPRGSDPGNLLILMWPQTYPARAGELQALREWLSQGNHVLILAALANFAPWANRAWDDDVLNELGLHYQERKPSESAQVTPSPSSESPRVTAVVWPEWIAAMAPLVPMQAQEWPRDPPPRYQSTALSLPMLIDSTQAEPVLTGTPLDQGMVWLAHFSGFFSNSGLNETSNARWFSRWIERVIDRDGVVFFDDMHQGVSDLYDPEAFYSDARLHATIVFLIAFWLVHVMGRGERLGPYVHPGDASRSSAFVTSLAQAYARNVATPDLARSMFKHFFNDVRRKFGHPQNAEPAWDILLSGSKMSPERVHALRRQFMQPPRRIRELVALHNQLRQWRQEWL